MMARLIHRLRQLFEPVPPPPPPPEPLAPNHSEARRDEMKARALRAMNQESTRRLYIDLEQIRANHRRFPGEGP